MDDRTRGPAIDIESIRWERIQRIVEARPAGGTCIDPTRFRPRHVGDGSTLPPTHVSRDGDVVRIRVNVMTRHGRRATTWPPSTTPRSTRCAWSGTRSSSSACTRS